MVDRCPSPDLLPELAELPESDPRRRHLERCPACQARLADYRDFMAGGTPCPPQELKRALGALDAGLRAAIAESAPPEARPARAGLRWLEHPALRLGLALAAILLLLVALNALPRGGREREIRLRVDDELPQSGHGLRLLAPRVLAGGGLLLRWEPVAGADAYRVRLLAADLSPLTERESGAATELRLAAAELRALLGEARVLVWQVEARADGDLLTQSAPATVALPAAP